MPLNNMKTWANGELVTAAQMNAEIRDPVNALTPGHQVVTTAQKTALTGVATGTMVYDSTLGVTQFWNGTLWTSVPQQRIGVKVHLTANASAAATVSWTAFQYDTDPAGAMWSAGDPTKVTIQTAGLWQLSFSGAWQATSSVVAQQVRIIRNAAFDVAYGYQNAPSAVLGYWAIHETMACAVGDYFQSVVQVGGVGAQVFGVATEQASRTTFTATRLSA